MTKLPDSIRIQIADKIVRVFSIVINITMLLVIVSVWILGDYQYHRMIPAIIAMAATIPGWLFIQKGKPLIGVWFVFASIVLGILSGMILSGGVKALSYIAVLFCVTPIIVLHGVRGGVIFALTFFVVGLLFYRLDTLGILHKVNAPPAILLLAFITIYVFIQIFLVWTPVRLLFNALIDSQHQSRALEKTETRLKETKRLLEETQAISKLGGWEYEIDTQRLTWTDEVYRIHGMAPEEEPVDVISAMGYYPPEHRVLIDQAFRQAVNKGEPYDLEVDLIRKDNQKIIVRTIGQPIFHGGRVTRVTGNIVDITKGRMAEKELQESQERYRFLVENTTDGHFICEYPSGDFIFLNQTMCVLLNHTQQSVKTLTLWDIIDKNDHENLRKSIEERAEGKAPNIESNIRSIIRNDGTKFRAEVSTSLVTYKGKEVLQGVMEDITEKERLIKQLQQAQKMEAIGRLAGGVAHDYNNMLTVISGYSEMSLLSTDPETPIYQNLLEISKAAAHSQSVTRQLLAFARKEAIEPQVLDLNSAIENMIKMIRRLIGEDIDLVWHPTPEIWPIKMDPSQIDQILANLCVNAKDAIVNTGKISIETTTAAYDERYCTEHTGFIPGEFVVLTITDDGAGMDKETMEKIYDPFYTTKAVGKGTGLGLSTVYGIVKQNRGFIKVCSEMGSGTSFQIHLPRHKGKIAQRVAKVRDEIPKGNGETVLIVEDEPSALKMIEKFFLMLNYRCILANAPAEALRLAQIHAKDISLLVTDVVMPEMNGRELAERLAGQYPHIKNLYMSGYTAEEIDDRGVINEGLHFIQKPFSVEDLALKIKMVLEQQ